VSKFSEVKGILFDLDGVIFDSEPLWEISVTKTIEHFYHVTPSSDFIKSVLARSNQEILKLYIEEYHPKYDSLEAEIKKTNSFLENHFLNNMVSRIELFPDVIPVLQKLKNQNLLLAVVTNAPKIIVSKILHDVCNLDTYFDSIVTIDDVHHGKPNPEMLNQTLNDLELLSDEVIFIGDSISTDGKASAEANISFILINRNDSGMEKDVKTISSLDELFPLMKNKYSIVRD